MTRQHHPHKRILGAPVRIPQPLEDGKVRCLGCSAVVTLTKNHHIPRHRTPAGEPCAYTATYAPPIDLEKMPPVNLATGRAAKRPRGPSANPKVSRLDAGSNCQYCGKWLPGERSVCGACYVKKEAERR